MSGDREALPALATRLLFVRWGAVVYPAELAGADGVVTEPSRDEWRAALAATEAAPCREDEAYSAGRLAGYEEGLDATEAEPRFSADTRRSIIERYRAVADRLGKPMSAFEMAGAVGADSRTDLNAGPFPSTARSHLHAAYDRRGLLNVIDALLPFVPEPSPTPSLSRVRRWFRW